MVTLKRLVDSGPYSENVARFTVAFRRNKDMGVEIPISPVVLHDANELRMVPSSLVTAAGTTVAWEPRPGRRIRLRGFSVTVDPATTTVAGATSAIIAGSSIENLVTLGITAPGIPTRFSSTLPGEGALLPINTNIEIYLSAALTAGNIVVTMWGYEE